MPNSPAQKLVVDRFKEYLHQELIHPEPGKEKLISEMALDLWRMTR